MRASLIIDIILVAILILCITVAARRGAFKAAASLGGTVLGGVLAFRLTPQHSGIAEGLLRPWVSRTVDSSEAFSGGGDKLTELLEHLSLPASLADGWKDKAESARQALAESVTDRVTALIAPAVTFVVIFLAVKLAVWLLSRLLSADVPVLRTVNRFAGGLLGAAAGLLLVFVLCWGAFRFAPEEELLGFLSREAVKSSVIGGIVDILVG